MKFIRTLSLGGILQKFKKRKTSFATGLLMPAKPGCPNGNNSFLKRRRKLIAKIDEQIRLVTDAEYKPTNNDKTRRVLKSNRNLGRFSNKDLL